jgi:uncharacterized protein (UPF0332 family)
MTKILVQKSDENITSAKLLIDNKHYASSVHCSYYSCVQLMIYLLIHKYNLDRAQIEALAKGENKGSHIFAKNYIYNKMKDSGIRFDARTFYTTTGELKNKREHADYHETIISEAFSIAALNEAGEINKILRKNFSDQL